MTKYRAGDYHEAKKAVEQIMGSRDNELEQLTFNVTTPIKYSKELEGYVEDAIIFFFDSKNINN